MHPNWRVKITVCAQSISRPFTLSSKASSVFQHSCSRMGTVSSLGAIPATCRAPCSGQTCAVMISAACRASSVQCGPRAASETTCTQPFDRLFPCLLRSIAAAGLPLRSLRHGVELGRAAYASVSRASPPVPPVRQIGNDLEHHFGPDCILEISRAKTCPS